MENDEFFRLIDRARESTRPRRASAGPDALREVLQKESSATVSEFASAYNRQLVTLNRWSVWGAGYVLAGGMGDDSFRYFRSWLVGKGSAAVTQALTDADGLAAFVDSDELDNEALEYVAVELLEERGAPVPAHAEDADGTPTGEEFNEETVEDEYPRLAAFFTERDEEDGDGSWFGRLLRGLRRRVRRAGGGRPARYPE